MSNTVKSNVIQSNKPEQATAAFAELLKQASGRGFYGAATLTLVVQDGHIQHLKVATERMIR